MHKSIAPDLNDYCFYGTAADHSSRHLFFLSMRLQRLTRVKRGLFRTPQPSADGCMLHAFHTMPSVSVCMDIMHMASNPVSVRSWSHSRAHKACCLKGLKPCGENGALPLQGSSWNLCHETKLGTCVYASHRTDSLHVKRFSPRSL